MRDLSAYKIQAALEGVISQRKAWKLESKIT